LAATGTDGVGDAALARGAARRGAARRVNATTTAVSSDK